jgi:TolB-like protein
MASIVPGYEYDIFISYRHNDNRSGWVTEFVNALQEELAATIKEPLSIYFDKNPHDGLLETHNVDKSLTGKLKCLIFIPIISQTYCDPKSFAWQYEFCAFNKLSKQDHVGRDIKLNRGNVASRILPVKIHDIDADDRSTFENEVGGVLRSIEFIYKEPGVNRPLKISDTKHDNQNKTDYRNQVNKLANAIKEIIQSIAAPIRKNELMALVTPDQQKPTPEKSIVVLPFINISNDPEQEYFSDGLTEELITELSRLRELLVISRSSAMTFKGSNKKISEVANELNVRYVLEGSVRKAGNNLRITAQLIDASTDTHLWAENYNSTLEDIFDIQEKVSRNIVGELELKISKKESHSFSERVLSNFKAFDFYLKARSEIHQWSHQSFDRALYYLNQALAVEGPNALLYGAISYVYWHLANIGVEVDANTNQVQEYVQKAFQLDPNSTDAHLAMGVTNLAFSGKTKEAAQNFKHVIKTRPNDFDANMWLAVVYDLNGKPDLAEPIWIKSCSLDPLNSFTGARPGFTAFYKGDFKNSVESVYANLKRDPYNYFLVIFYSNILACCNRAEEGYNFISAYVDSYTTDNLNRVYNIYAKVFLRQREEIEKLLTDDFIRWVKRDPQWSHFLAQMFAFAKMNDRAFEYLENAVNQGFCNYPLLSVSDPIHALLNGEPRFEKLLVRMKAMWEVFE